MSLTPTPSTDGALPFSTPARIQDLQGDAQRELDCQWNRNVHAFTLQAIGGNPWNSGFVNGAGTFVPSPAQSYYFDSATTAIPPGTPSQAVTWNAFPNRIVTYCGANQPPTNPNNLTQQQLWELGDTGHYTDAANKLQTFPQVPVTLCPESDWSGKLQPYGPYGPRGWQDEYCEWSVTRNGAGKISRVDFVCENPEYWYTLWRVDPQAVAQLYQDTLNCGLPAGSPNLVKVSVEDLYLKDPATGQAAIDPFTGKAAYNPLNKWNSGPASIRGANPGGGAMHLTSTPNTLQTEMGLAGAATVARTVGNVSAQALICCSQYGQENRNSDPHIGQSVNQLVDGTTFSRLALADPAGLYIQMPDFSQYVLPSDPKLPPGASAADCWQIVRGSETLTDPVTGQPYPGNFILHAAFQIPAAWLAAGVSFTVGDIAIRTGGTALPIQWASQLTETFDVGLFARALPAPAATPQTPLVNLDNPADPPYPAAQAQPVQLMYQSVWNALYNTKVDNVLAFPMNLASNSVIVPMPVRQGDRGLQAVLICGTAVSAGNQLPAVNVPGAEISVTVVQAAGLGAATYAAPGNSYPSGFQLLTLTIDVGATVAPGLYSVQVTNPGSGMPAAVPGAAFLNVFQASGGCT
jgi:hypothetical protein